MPNVGEKKYSDYVNGVNNGTIDMHESLVEMGTFACKVTQSCQLTEKDRCISTRLWAVVIKRIVDAETPDDPAIKIAAQYYIMHYEAIRARSLNQVH